MKNVSIIMQTSCDRKASLLEHVCLRPREHCVENGQETCFRSPKSVRRNRISRIGECIRSCLRANALDQDEDQREETAWRRLDHLLAEIESKQIGDIMKSNFKTSC